MVTNKMKRKNKIVEILKSKNITTQEELVSELKKIGTKITQATLSRDLGEIGVIRVHERNKIYYKFPIIDETSTQMHREVSVTEVKAIFRNETLIVIKTLSGCAQSVAAAIDSWNNPEILATIGGDDTVLVVLRTCKNIEKIYKYLKEKIDISI